MLLTFSIGNVWGSTGKATITFSDAGLSNQQDVSNITFSIGEYFTVSFTKGNANTAPTYYNSGTAIRCYATKNTANGNVITISRSDKGTESSAYITKITYNGTNAQGTTSFVYSGTTTSATSNTVTYDVSSKVTTANATLKETDNSKNGQFRLTGITIEYVYEGGSTEEATLSSISISGTPTKTEYVVGEKFDPSGLVVTGTYSDNSTQTITDGITWICDPETFTEANDNATVNVTAKVGEVSGSHIITGIKVNAPTTYTYNYDFSKISGLADWGTSYSNHSVDYSEAKTKIVFEKANKSNQTITNVPVTKGESVIASLTDANKCFTGIKFVCKQWGDKKQTITFNYSTDGGSTFQTLTPSVTSDNFTLAVDADVMPLNVDAIKFTFSSKSDQVGIASVHFNTADKYCQEYDITVNVTPEEGGLAEADVTKATEKKTITLTYAANNGYRFDEWEVKAGEQTISTTQVEGQDSYTFVMPAANVIATAKFIKTYELAIYSQENGTINVKEGLYAEGDKIAVSLTPNAGYEGGALSIMDTDGKDVTTTYYDAETGQITMPAFDIYVSATFTAKSCTPLSSPVIKVDKGGTTYNTIKVTWDAIENASKYVVSLRDENETEVVAPTETAELFYVFSALKVNTGYYCYVKALPADESTYCESEEAREVISTTDYPAATLTLSENGNEVLWDGTHKINDVVTLPTDIDNLCVGKQLVGWSEVKIETPSATEPTSQYYKAGTQYTLKVETQTLYAVYATVDAGTKDIKLNIESYATTNNWSNGTAYTNVTIDGVTFSVAGGGNNGKFYTSNNTWRFYDGGSLTISATEQIASITAVPSSVTFTQQKNGTYKFSGKAEIKEIIVRIAYSNIAGFTTTCTASIAAPTFTPTSGIVFNTEDVVMLENIINGATVYYTINGEDPTTTSAVYDADNGIELTESGEYVIKAIAVKGEAQSEMVTATYGVLKPFASLDELIKCQYAEGKNVTVSFSDIAITKISGKQVTLDCKKDEKNVMIYNSTEIPTEWNAKEKGKLSATSITCEWKKYINKKDEFIGWELTPSDWTGFTYEDPEHIISLEITGDVTEKSYSAGQQLKSDGLIVTGIYSDNTTENPHTETITEGLSWSLPTLTEGQTDAKVTVSYKEPILDKTVTSEEYTITGLSVSAPRILDHIEISTESTQQTDFFVGRPFTHDGLKVLAYYSISGVITGDPVDVTKACTCTTPDMTIEGKQTITITYVENEDSKTTAYDINLKYMNLTDLVSSTEIKDKDYVYVKFEDMMITNLYKGSRGDYMGIYLNVQKDNKDIEIYTSKKIPDEWNVEIYGTVSGTLDNVEWTYYKNGDVWELKPSDWSSITYKAPVIEALTISGTATTLTYTEGATFTPTGLKVEATIADKQWDVTNLVSWTFNPTTLAVGTTSVTAKATYKEKEATTIINDVKVIPIPTPEGEPIVIAFEYNDSYYALTTDLTVYTFPEGAGVVAGKMVNIPEADRANITWYRASAEGGVTFQRKSDGQYLTAGSSTKLSASTTPCIWSLQDGYYTASTTVSDIRTLLYQAGNVNMIRYYQVSSAGATNYSGYAMYLSEYIDGEIADVRDLNGNIGTLCLKKKVIAFEGAKFYRIYSKDAEVSASVKNVTFEEITEILEAGEACIFEPEDNATKIRVVYTGDAVTAPLTGNGLVGIFEDVDDLRTYTGNKGVDYADVFVVQNNRIRKAGEGLTSVPNRAYINMSQVGCNVPQKAGRRYIVLGKENTGTTTGIDDVQTDNAPLGTYDVLGRKVGETSAAGLYIINGKKVLIVK